MEEILQYKNLHDKFYMMVTEYASVYDAVKTSEDCKNPFRDIIGTDIPSLLNNWLVPGTCPYKIKEETANEKYI